MLLFVSHLIRLSTMASLSHHISLSLHVPTRFFSFEKHPLKSRLRRLEQFIEEDLHLLGVCRVGFLEVGLWRSRLWWSRMEVRLAKSNRRGMVAIFGYFWVRFLGSWVCGGVVWWFAAVCSWVSGMVCSKEISL